MLYTSSAVRREFIKYTTILTTSHLPVCLLYNNASELPEFRISVICYLSLKLDGDGEWGACIGPLMGPSKVFISDIKQS